MQAAHKVWYAANREKRIAQTRQYQLDHPEVLQAADKKYKATHRDEMLPKVRARSAAWREKNRDKDRAAARRWTANNRERARSTSKRWRSANADVIREKIQRWHKANPGKRRVYGHRYDAQKRGNGGSYTIQEWQQLKQQYEYYCLCCHRREPDITLTVDHVIPVSLGGANTIDNIQPLCFSCNSSKGNHHTTDYRLRWTPLGLVQSQLDL